MAENLANVVFGTSNLAISIGEYVTAKGAGTLVDLGILDGGFELDMSEEQTDIMSDKHLGPLSQEPHKRGLALKFVAEEAAVDNLLKFWGAKDADKSGVSPNFTLEPSVDNPARYHQIQIADLGLGTGKIRTWTFWRARRFGPFKYAAKRDQPRKFEATFSLMQEITGTGPSSFFKFVES